MARVESSVDYQRRYRRHVEAAYAVGSEYESKGRFGRMMMRLANRSDTQLEVGRVLYDQAHRRERAVAAHNQEVMESWDQ